MQELSLVVALLVVYNIYLTFKISNLRKQILKQTGRLTREVLTQSMPLIAKQFNKDLNKAVSGMEDRIVEYIKDNSNIPPPPLN